MKVRSLNYYGYDTEKVNENFSGCLTFVNSFCVNGESVPSQVYRAARPSKEKGHKEYMILTTIAQYDDLGERTGAKSYVRGMTKKQITPFARKNALYCLRCADVIWSAYRHDFVRCECEGCFIDGGDDPVFRYGIDPDVTAVLGTVDLLTDEFTRTELHAKTKTAAPRRIKPKSLRKRANKTKE